MGWSAYMWILPVDFGWRKSCLNSVTVRIFISIIWLMIEESQWKFFLYIYFRERGGGNRTSTSKHEAVCCKCMRICFYWESLYIPLICLVVFVFRSALCHLSECELQWFDPGFSLKGGVCCGICYKRDQTCLVVQPTTCCGLVGAKGALGWGSTCRVFPRAKDASGCVGVSGWQAGLGILGVNIVSRGLWAGRGCPG